MNDSRDGMTRQERYLRTQFLRSLAHAIRSPLSVAAGALDEIASTPKEQQEFLLQFARRNVRRLAALADALSRVAELEAGTLAPSLGECDVNLVVRQTVASSKEERPPSRRPAAAVTVAIDEGRLIADADPRLLGIVLGEVIGNALRFAREEVRIAARIADGHVVIDVEDDGPGVEPERVESLFDRYRSARERGSDSDLALGLPLVRDYMSMQGGSVAIERRAEGSGTRVRLELRRAAVA